MNNIDAELDKNNPHYIHNLFLCNANLWDSPTEQWAMSEDVFIKIFKAEQKQLSDEEIEALAKKEYPLLPNDKKGLHNESVTSFSNAIIREQREAFIKGCKIKP